MKKPQSFGFQGVFCSFVCLGFLWVLGGSFRLCFFGGFFLFSFVLGFFLLFLCCLNFFSTVSTFKEMDRATKN